MRIVSGSEEEATTIQLSEVLGALSHALDLTEGQPVGHCVRATWIGFHIGREMGLPRPASLGTLPHGDAEGPRVLQQRRAHCELYLSDDLSFKRDFKTVSDSLPKVLGFVFSHTGLKAGLAERFRAVLNILQNGGAITDDLIQTRCQRGAEIARQLRFPASVCEAIHALDEHWNGGGRPDRLAGPAIPLYARVALLAQVVDVFHTAAGPAAAIAEVRARSGTWFDPQVVACFEAVAAEPGFWETLASDEVEEAVFALAPGQPDRRGRGLPRRYRPCLRSDHRRQEPVHLRPLGAGRGLRRHDRGRTRLYAGTPPLAEARRASSRCRQARRLERHPRQERQAGRRGVAGHAQSRSLSETILTRAAVFHEMARIGGGHHERLDGKGYPRGLSGDAIEPETRIVSVADVFDALTADRPYRAAMSLEKALGIMRADIGTAFDPICFAALERALAAIEGDLARAA